MSKIVNLTFKSNLLLSQQVSGSSGNVQVTIARSGTKYASAPQGSGNLFWCREGEVVWNLGLTRGGYTDGMSMTTEGDIIVGAQTAGNSVIRNKWNYTTKVYDLTVFNPRLTYYAGSSYYDDVAIGKNGLFCYARCNNDEGGGASFGYYTTDITAANPVWSKALGGDLVGTTNARCRCAVSNNGGNIIVTGRNYSPDTAYRIPDPATPTDYLTRASLGITAIGCAINADSSLVLLIRQVGGTGDFREICYSTDFTNWNVGLQLAAGATIFRINHVEGNIFIAATTLGIYFCYPDPSTWRLLIPGGFYSVAASQDLSRVICNTSAAVYLYKFPSLPASGKSFATHGTTLRSINPSGVIEKYSP